MIPLAISVIPGKVKDSTQGYKEQSYTMNLVAIKELWDRCAVMTLLKAKAKAILKTDAAYISFDEHLFYRQCEKEAQTPL
uniref:Transposase n=1 Tax=Acrobeloides nanus TaxID=290746 RepID=A0A914C7C6_9BILA